MWEKLWMNCEPHLTLHVTSSVRRRALTPGGLLRLSIIVVYGEPERSEASRKARLLRQAGDPISAPALSQLERGVNRPSAATLTALASALEFPISYFAARRGAGGADEPEPVGYFRSLRSTSVRDRKRALGHVFLLHDLVAAIEDRLRLPAINLPTNLTAPSSTVEGIKSIAADARRHLGMPQGRLSTLSER